MTTPGTRHFLDLADQSSVQIRGLLDDAGEVRSLREQTSPSASGERLYGRFLTGRYVALLFEKPATRTPLHCEIATRDLGGHPIVLTARDMQMSRDETVGATARVLSRRTDRILYRPLNHERLCDFAKPASFTAAPAESLGNLVGPLS